LNNVDIPFNDNSISKVHCIIYFENSNWFIIDGDGTKSSTNGTWIQMSDYKTINENMVFRVGTTFFQANYSEN